MYVYGYKYSVQTGYVTLCVVYAVVNVLQRANSCLQQIPVNLFMAAPANPSSLWRPVVARRGINVFAVFKTVTHKQKHVFGCLPNS